ncbi:MAG: hypothetical protein HY534_02750 [Chloroflexi bacterium]|nr:hypothetical protein [Chloroflexota bacterium]
MIRPIRIADALTVRSLIRGSDGVTELTAPNWPKTPPENRLPGPIGLLGASLLPQITKSSVGLAVGKDGVQGLVVARQRSLGLVWDLEHLVAGRSSDHVVEMLHWACNRALEAGARRVFVETAEDGPGFEGASRAGFEICTRGSMYALPSGFAVDRTDAVPARPRLRSDEQALFQLYTAVVPAPVRAAEALNYEEWAALHRGRKAWSPSLLGGQDYVWEMGSKAVGWMHLIYGERAQYLTILIHPQSDAFVDRMLKDALGQLSNKVPVLVDVREYQTVLQSGLENLGFSKGHDYVVWVRQLAQRLPETSAASVRAQPSALA